jgi:hypothetical protein
MSVSSELSNSVLMKWDADYPNDEFKSPQGNKIETVNTDQNSVVAREQIQDCGFLSNLVTSFKEEYTWLEVQSVWLIWKLKEDNGFQDWHQDLANNGQTVYTIVVNLGSLELQTVAREINKTIMYMLLKLRLYLHLTILTEMMKALSMVMMKERRSKHLSVTVKERQSTHLSVTKKER